MPDKDLITVTGVVGTEPSLSVGASGTPCCTFRLASTTRKLDAESKTWSDGDTNWYSIVAFRRLAANIQASLHKGDRVLVAGRLRIQDWTGNDGRSRTSVEILADCVGPDLVFAVATISRNPRPEQNAAATVAGFGPTPESEPAPSSALSNGNGTASPGVASDDGPGEAQPSDDADPAAVLVPF